MVLLAGLVAARPGDILDVEFGDFEHDQSGTPGRAVHGEWEGVDAYGNEYEVKYVADAGGFRIL